MAFEAIHKMHADGDLPAELGADQLADQYITAVKKGILKTISKMGISTLRSYHAAQQFEAVGLNHDVVRQYFTGTASRIEGADLDALAAEALARHRDAFGRREAAALDLDYGGDYHFRLDGENHLWNPTTVTRLQHAVVQNDPQAYEDYARAVNQQGRDLCTLRGLFELLPGEARAAGRGRAGRRDRQAVLHRRHVARLDQQGGPRGAGGGDEPAGRHVEHRRRGRRPGALPAACPTATRPTAASSRWPAPGSA